MPEKITDRRFLTVSKMKAKGKSFFSNRCVQVASKGTLSD